MKKFIGRTDEALARAEDLAYSLASSHNGAKQFHVVEVGTERDGEQEEKGRIYVVDNDGLEEIEHDERFAWVNPITAKGHEEEDEDEDPSSLLEILNRALNHAVSSGVITDSEADAVEQKFKSADS